MKKKKRVLAYGEVMLRVAMDNFQMMEQTKDARLNFTGTGMNVLSGVVHFEHEGVLLTQLPENRLGAAAKAEIRKLGIDDSLIKTGGDHMGIYILEQGYGNRPSEVTYLDRIHSSFGMSQWTEEEIKASLDGVDMVHICGISLILTQQTRNAAFILAQHAHEGGIQVVFDFNYRPSLNVGHTQKWVKERYETILPFADVVVGSQRDLTELLELDKEKNCATFEELCQLFIDTYQLKHFVGSRRTNQNNQRYLEGFIYSNNSMVRSQKYPVYVFDRVGTGDAYAAGISVGVLENWPEQEMVEFATASAVLAHTTLGDSPILTKKQVELFIQDQNIDIVR